MICILKGDKLAVRTDYNGKYDLVQTFTGFLSENMDANAVVNFGVSTLIEKSEKDMFKEGIILAHGWDEPTPFKVNTSYIGANHGQSDGVLIKTNKHNKTYADIGSVWLDEAGIKWTLLKIAENEGLLFLSENIGESKWKYDFAHNITGDLKYISDGVNTETIHVGETVNRCQIYSSVRTKEKKIYAVKGGVYYELSQSEEIVCDQIDIIEKYEIINPALVGDALREAGPKEGYTEPQCLAVGDAIIDYSMIYRITNDGTVMSIFEHEILEDVTCCSYGGIQYIEREDAFGGGVYRYMPKIKPFEVDGKEYDFAKWYNVTEGNIPHVTLCKEYWENEKDAPNREVSYMENEAKETVTAFASGYIPVWDGAPDKRPQKTSAWGFLYPSKKHYPFIVNEKAFAEKKKGIKIRGAGYKKYQDLSQNSSKTGYLYTIPFEDDLYLYADYQNAGEDKITLLGAENAELIEKSDNVFFEIENESIKITVTDEKTYGYIVFKLKEKSFLTKNAKN